MEELLIICEGYGDVAAAPVLTRRMLGDIHNIYDCNVKAHRRHGLDHLKANDWNNFKRYHESSLAENCPVMWMVDCDDDCAWHVSKSMHDIMEGIGTTQPIGICLWEREYESMFLHDIENLKSALKIQEDIVAPSSIRNIRGAKGWISDKLPRGKIYKETTDQKRLSAQVDLLNLIAVYRDFQHYDDVLAWLINQSTPAIYPVN